MSNRISISNATRWYTNTTRLYIDERPAWTPAWTPANISTLFAEGTSSIVYANGNLRENETTVDYIGVDRLYLGGDNTSGNYCKVKIGEIVIHSADDITREKTEGYLAWKWGLVSKLPSDHPYKNSPPYGTKWESTLYPSDWTPPTDTNSFYTDGFIQDFSYAGYKKGEEAIPSPSTSVFNVVDYGADNTGSTDSTSAIQDTIDAAALAGGGVVYLPSGTYSISPGVNSHCLSITSNNIILRGEGVGSTYILNTETNMRLKSIINVSTSVTESDETLIVSDLTGPTKIIPVADSSAYSAGDIVLLKWDFTDGWVADHGQEAYWNSTNGYPQPCNYFRKVVSVDYVNNIITIDVPTRYSMFQRDNARVLRTTGFLSEVGIEDFSIGNVENTTGGFGNDDWLVEGTTGYEVHGSYVIKMYDSYDSWIRRVYTYQPASNSTSTCHILSNGIQVDNSFQLTLEDCYFQRTEYGGGGNGCMFVLRSNDILVKNCIAEFNRHGFLISTANASGIVLFGCTDKRTERATGLSGIDGYVAGSRSSGHHLHFSHSNLLDGCTVIDSFFSFKHRMNFGTIPHGLTAAHCVVWNMKSSENEYLYTVETEQGRYGYVIGTCAECPDVNNLNPATNNTEPLDFVEGKGNGNTLTPQSLYLDQFNKRTNI